MRAGFRVLFAILAVLFAPGVGAAADSSADVHRDVTLHGRPHTDYFGPPLRHWDPLHPMVVLGPEREWGAPWKMLVLFVEFPDKPALGEVAYFEDMFFGRHEGAHEGRPYPNETMADLYARASGERLTFGDVTSVGWLTAPQPYTYYTSYHPTNPQGGCWGLGDPANPGFVTGAWELVRFALEEAVAGGVDLDDFDNDGDGQPEGILLVHAGPGAEQSDDDGLCNPSAKDWGDLWSHQHANLFDGRGVRYVVGPERSTRSASGLSAIGVWAHEFGHILGLPDLYAKRGQGYGVGCWDLMGYGITSCDPLFAGEDPGEDPGELAAWTRQELAWSFPKPVTANVCNRKVDPAQLGGDTFRVTPNPAEPRDYFLVEYRARVGMDKELPGDRVCVWHVDENKLGGVLPNRFACMPREEQSAGACAADHYAVSVVQPDGEYSLENGSYILGPGDCLAANEELSSEDNWDLWPWSGKIGNHWRVRVDSTGPQARLSIIVDADAETPEPIFATDPAKVAAAVRGRVWKYQPKLQAEAGMPHWVLTKGPEGMEIDAESGLIAWRVPVEYANDEVFVGLQVQNCGGIADQFFTLAIVEPGAEPGCGCATQSGGPRGDLVFGLALMAIWALRRRAVN